MKSLTFSILFLSTGLAMGCDNPDDPACQGGGGSTNESTRAYSKSRM